MPKAEVPRSSRRSQRELRPADLPDVVEGQIVEICWDLAVQAKRMRQLQEQANELRTVIRQWAGQWEADREPVSRGEHTTRRAAPADSRNTSASKAGFGSCD